MKLQKLLTLVVAVVLFLGGMSCDRKPPTMGSYNNIIVLCDKDVWKSVEDELTEALEIEILTPQPEVAFKLVQREPESITDLKRYRNLLLVGALDTPGTTKNLFDQMLSPENRASIEKGENIIFQKPDAWARDQLLGVVVAKDVATLEEKIIQEKQRLFDMFDLHTKNVLTKSLYTGHEKKDVANGILKKHGWTVDIPLDYVLAVDSLDARFVWLRRLNPQRWFSVYYEQVDDPSLLSKEWIMEKRNQFAKDFLSGDVIVENDSIKVKEKTVDFNNRYAIQLDGIWENTELVLGGPFRSYGFYNKADERIYIVDIAVYAPGERKLPFMKQLEAMAFTFKTKDEL